ncbi:MAG: hypothetical protein ABIB71_08430 [Candidatus Woesearchaeota archaeon]
MALVKGGGILAPGTEGIAPRFVVLRGSDCTGTHGTNNRTFDLSGVTVNEFVYVQGSFLHAPDYSKATVGSASRITLINKVYDQFYIEVYYWV